MSAPVLAAAEATPTSPPGSGSHQHRARFQRFAVPVFVPILFVLAYWGYSQTAGNPYFPPISQIAAAARDLWFGTGFTRDVVPSLTNLVLGYLAGLILGLAIGIVLGRVVIIRHLVQPLTSFGLTLPSVALLPLFLILFGVDPLMQRAVIAFAVFFIVVVNTTDGIRGIEPVLLEVSSVYRISAPRRIVQISLPAASTHILAAARVALAVALLVMVVGEMVGASRGIGAVTLLAQQEFNYARMWAGIFLLAVLGIVLNIGFLALERRLLARLGQESADSARR